METCLACFYQDRYVFDIHELTRGLGLEDAVVFVRIVVAVDGCGKGCHEIRDRRVIFEWNISKSIRPRRSPLSIEPIFKRRTSRLNSQNAFNELRTRIGPEPRKPASLRMRDDDRGADDVQECRAGVFEDELDEGVVGEELDV